MFESYSEVSRVNKRKKWTTLAAVGGQVALVAVLVALPLWFPAPVEVAEVVTPIVAPPSAALPAPASGRAAATALKTPVRQFDPSKLTIPKTTPQAPTPIAGPVTEDPPSIDNGVVGGVTGGVAGGQLGGVLGGIIGAAPSVAPPPPPPPPAPAPVTPSEIRVGGNIQAARLMSAPQPAYPYAAQVAGVHGDVTLNAVIGPDGKIENLSVVSGPAVLVSSAMDAVKQWVYQPTVLNGKAVTVNTQIVVHFQMG